MKEASQNIYEVPIWEISFMGCLEGKTIQGQHATNFLVEASSPTQARMQLKRSPGFWKNYNKKPTEERVKLHPFKLRQDEEITQVLECEMRGKDERGYRCGEYGMCCLEIGVDPLHIDSCPYNK
jgi:hypothetical protein